MRTILNVLWNVPGLGFVAAFFWVLAGLLMAITIIGLPWTWSAFQGGGAAPDGPLDVVLHHEIKPAC